MPCPYFEPVRISTDRKQESARLPLLDEYEGLCRALAEPVKAPSELQFRACNHGYSRQLCSVFPAAEERSSIRFDVVTRDRDWVELLCVEERDYAPYRWNRFRYSIETGAVEPGISDICALSQLQAFCHSYLQRFS